MQEQNNGELSSMTYHDGPFQCCINYLPLPLLGMMIHPLSCRSVSQVEHDKCMVDMQCVNNAWEMEESWKCQCENPDSYVLEVSKPSHQKYPKF